MTKSGGRESMVNGRRRRFYGGTGKWLLVARTGSGQIGMYFCTGVVVYGDDKELRVHVSV